MRTQSLTLVKPGRLNGSSTEELLRIAQAVVLLRTGQAALLLQTQNLLLS